MKKLITLAVLALSLYCNAQERVTTSKVVGFPVDYLVAADTQVYFYGNLSGKGHEICRISNKMKTAVGTGLINNTAPGKIYDTEIPRCITLLNGKMYFAADDGINGSELWSVSPTSAPKLVKDVYPGSAGSMPSYLTALNGKLYFAAVMEILQYDPATDNLKSIGHYGSADRVGDARRLFAYNNKIYYTGRLTQNNLYGEELWEYDPATDSNRMVFDLDAGTGSSMSCGFYVFNGILYFIGYTVANGFELYSYDWVSAPKRLTDIVPGSGDGFNTLQDAPRYITDYNGKILATTGALASKAEVLQYDPATGKTTVIDTMHCYEMCKYAGKVFLHGFRGTFADQKDLGIYSYDGVNLPVLEYANSASYELTPLNDWLYFIGPSTIATPSSDLYRMKRFPLTIENIHGNCTAIIYPNPANGNAFLDMDVKQTVSLSIRLTDIAGKTVYSIPSKQYSAAKYTIQLPISDMPAGQYFYTIYSDEGQMQVSGKITKQ